MSDATTQLAAVRACWHPVGYSKDLGAQLIAVTLLGERLVLGGVPPGDEGLRTQLNCSRHSSRACDRIPSLPRRLQRGHALPP